MTFEPGNAVVVRDEQLLATYGRAFRKIGKTIAVVPLGADVHAGHIELIRAAKSLLGAYVFVTYSGEEVPETFRNEGVDSSHSPEFTMLETYQAWGTYKDGAKTMQELVQFCAKEVFGSTTVTLPDGTEYDFGGEWKFM